MGRPLPVCLNYMRIDLLAKLRSHPSMYFCFIEILVTYLYRDYIASIFLSPFGYFGRWMSSNLSSRFIYYFCTQNTKFQLIFILTSKYFSLNIAKFWLKIIAQTISRTPFSDWWIWRFSSHTNDSLIRQKIFKMYILPSSIHSHILYCVGNEYLLGKYKILLASSPSAVHHKPLRWDILILRCRFVSHPSPWVCD